MVGQKLKILRFILHINTIAFSVLMLLVWRQEEHPACKKTEWWGAGMIIWSEVQICIWLS